MSESFGSKSENSYRASSGIYRNPRYLRLYPGHGLPQVPQRAARASSVEGGSTKSEVWKRERDEQEDPSSSSLSTLSVFFSRHTCTYHSSLLFIIHIHSILLIMAKKNNIIRRRRQQRETRSDNNINRNRRWITVAEGEKPNLCGICYDAAQDGHFDLVESILRLHLRNLEINILMMCAVQGGNLRIVDLCIRYGAIVDGLTMSRAPNMEVLKYLIGRSGCRDLRHALENSIATNNIPLVVRIIRLGRRDGIVFDWISIVRSRITESDLDTLDFDGFENVNEVIQGIVLNSMLNYLNRNTIC